MRHTRTRILPTALVALALALSACSDGKVGGEPVGSDRPELSTPSMSPKPSVSVPASEPTTAEYEEAHALYHALSDVLNDANHEAGDYQAAVRKARDRDPAGFPDSPKVTKAVAALQAATTARDAALAELTEHPAMADEELAAAYQAFTTGYAEAVTYQDGFNDSYPLFLEVGDVCAKVFEVRVPARGSSVAYAEAWLAEHATVAAPCLELSTGLASSANEDMVRVSELYQRLIEQREAAFIGVRDLTMGPDQSVAALEKANKRFLRDYEKTTKFSDRLGELVPLDLYDAVDPIFKDRVGELDPE
jgi:hypothetical protein